MKRLLHTFPEVPGLAGQNIISAAPKLDPRMPQKPCFKVVGLGSLLQAELPPSSELLAKRNALTGILGSEAPSASIYSRSKLSRPILRSLFARQPILRQSIVGTSPLTCLISSTRNEFLSALELDGTSDWVVKAPIQAYTGRQLRLSPGTGYMPGSAPFAHTIVSGRGWICFATPSSTVQIQVPQGESVLVSQRHIAAFRTDSNVTRNIPKTVDVKYDFGVLREEPVAPLVLPKDPSSELPSLVGTTVRSSFRRGLEIISHIGSSVRRFFRSGNSSPFVEIYGPSTVYVSSSSGPPPQPTQKPE